MQALPEAGPAAAARPADPPPGGRILAPIQQPVSVAIRWYAPRSRALPILGATLATLVLLPLDIVASTLWLGYVMVSAPFTGWEGPF